MTSCTFLSDSGPVLYSISCTQLAPKDCVAVLVGTYTPVEESDDDGKIVNTQMAEAYAERTGHSYVECDPLDPEAVSRVISHLMAQVVRRWGADTLTRGEILHGSSDVVHVNVMFMNQHN